MLSVIGRTEVKTTKQIGRPMCQSNLYLLSFNWPNGSQYLSSPFLTIPVPQSPPHSPAPTLPPSNALPHPHRNPRM